MAPLSKPTGLLVRALGIGLGVRLAFGVLLPIKRWRLRNVPGNTYKPGVGDALEAAKMRSVQFIHKLCTEHSNSPVCKFYLGTTPYVVVRDPKLGKEMLLNCHTTTGSLLAPWSPDEERAPWDNVLVFLNGDKWSKSRRAIVETAHVTMLPTHAAGMSKQVTRLIEVLDRFASENRPFNAQSFFMALAQDVIVEAMFGTDICSLGSISKEAVSASMLSSAMAALSTGGKAADMFLLTPEQIEDGWWDKYPLGSPEFGRRLISSTYAINNMLFTNTTWLTIMCLLSPSLVPLWRLLARFLPDKNALLQLRVGRGIRQACLQLIRKWKAEHVTGDQVNATSRPRGLMSYAFLNEDGHTYNENELVGMVLGTLFGGFDPTGTTLAMSLYHLAKNPDKQKKAQQEVDQVLGGKEPSMKDVNDLPYIFSIINEVLRLCTPAAQIIRQVGDQEYVHPGGAFRIPKHTPVWLPAYSYHRDPSIWPRPDEFLPERWIQPGHVELAPTDPEVFLPFGAGPRRCPGQKLAMLEMKLVLARLLQRYDFSLAQGYSEPVLRSTVVLAPDRVMLKVSYRI